MPKNLVIVESPAKARTIERFLGSDYAVRASYGHVRDLPAKELGVDIEHAFRPKYQIIPKAKKTIAMLKKELEDASDVYLATDFDREGEAISWHIVQALGLDEAKVKRSKLKIKRITFHEITKSALEDAVKNPRAIDMRLVDAQQARRILDRLVGYKLSPFLWKKVVGGLSAGRVQSVAVRLIVDRERDIKNFKSTEYWTIIAELSPAGEEKKVFKAELTTVDGKKLDQFALGREQDAKLYQEIFRKADWRVEKIEVGESQKYPFPPFTTSTLQQDANRRLGYSSKKTMRLAQDLYESGKITYMRTDSITMAWVAINTARQYIEKTFGQPYLPQKPRIYKTRAAGAQEAHEAIRPTYIAAKELTGNTWSDDHRKLYDLIWSRTVASQMNPAVLDFVRLSVLGKTKVVRPKEGLFLGSGQSLKFDGFSKVYPVKIDQVLIPRLAKDTTLDLKDIVSKQHFTKPPDRYSEATLIKALEEYGIGRPSTYAPIISTIQDRGYVYLQQRFFYPREIGEIVTDLLVKHFPDIVNIGFTAQMEESFDEIAEGKKEWTGAIRSFYDPFEKNLLAKEKSVDRVSFDKEEAGQNCPKCDRPMIVKVSRFGKFLACSGYPACKTTKYLAQKTGLKCSTCQDGEVVERFTRQRKIFWGCSRYPDCKYASWTKPVNTNTPIQANT